MLPIPEIILIFGETYTPGSVVSAVQRKDAFLLLGSSKVLATLEPGPGLGFLTQSKVRKTNTGSRIERQWWEGVEPKLNLQQPTIYQSLGIYLSDPGN